MSISNLPLQEMIASVVREATTKMAGHPDDWAARAAMEGSDETPPKEEEEEESGITNPVYIDKLASACEFIAANVHNIEPPNRGVLGDAIATIKMAGEPVPPATSSKGALETTTGMSGEQQYKKDKPKAGFDSAASTASTPEGTAGLPAGATQMENDMESAPGQSSGSVPTAKYPAAGVFHAGPSKTASAQGILDQLKGGGKRLLEMTKAAGQGKSLVTPKVIPKTASAGEKARQAILAKLAGEKLAGEDVMKSNISSPKSGGPSPGDGEMDALTAEEVPSNPTDSSGYGNPGRSHVQSNAAAMSYTKGDAKKPQGKQMAEVLKNPAFSQKHDGKLQEQLQNTGKAGVKIAGAQMREFLKQAAANGSLTQEMVDGIKKVAEHDEGCTCGGAGECKVCKLKALKDEASKTSMMGDQAGGGAY